jgi:hypothetical protein
VTEAAGRRMWRRGWAVLATLAVAWLSIAVGTRPTLLPQDIWSVSGGYSSTGPDGPPDPTISFAPAKVVNAAPPETGALRFVRPSSLLRWIEALGIEVHPPFADYRYTGEVRRWAPGPRSPPAIRYVRIDAWTPDCNRFTRLAGELRAAAEGRMSAAELRAAMDTAAGTPWQALLRAWEQAVWPLDAAARGALVAKAIEAFGDEVEPDDEVSIIRLLRADPRFVALEPGTRPRWLELEVAEAVSRLGCGVEALRLAWRHWWPSDEVRQRLLLRHLGERFADAQAAIDAVPPEGRATVLAELRRVPVGDRAPGAAIRIAAVGLRFGDATWFATVADAVRLADSERDYGTPGVVACAGAGTLRWVLDPALAERLLAGTDAASVTVESRRARWAEIADVLERESAGWTFDGESRTWRESPPPAAPR